MRKEERISKVIMFRIAQRITIILQGKFTFCLIFNFLARIVVSKIGVKIRFNVYMLFIYCFLGLVTQ